MGPTQSGKTYFVQQILENSCIVYEEQKSIRIFWYYNQWQECYEELKKSLGKSIRFERGVPELSEDLCEISARYNNIIILNDLMAEATDSPVVSRLFTQGRHRNASVILLLQNMFPKGKYYTDISRNAQYLALFRSPSDRKQIGIIGERMFDKNRVHFMHAYYKETEKPYGYLLVDNKPGTPPDNQILADLFGECYAYHFGVNSTEPHTCGNQACRQTQHSNQNHVFKEEACANRHLVGCPNRRVAKIHLGSCDRVCLHKPNAFKFHRSFFQITVRQFALIIRPKRQR